MSKVKVTEQIKNEKNGKQTELWPMVPAVTLWFWIGTAIMNKCTLL